MKRIDRQRYLELVPLKQAVENDLLRIPDVTGVDVGYKEVGGEQTDDMAILVFVRRKGEFAERDRIPGEIHGIPSDVIEAEFTPLTGSAAATAGEPNPLGATVDPRRYDPLVGGCSTAPARIGNWYGTVGIPVRERATGRQRVLSCWHVFCDDPGWERLDRRITQPAIKLGGRIGSDVIGSVVAARLGQIVIDFGYDWYVDCAISDAIGRSATATILRIGHVKGSTTPIEGDLVRKYGATTEHTYGVVASTNFTTVVTYSSVGKVTFYYQYRITAPDRTMPPFSLPGDSGAIVVDTESMALGLLFAGDKGGAYGIANPMYMVLGALNIELIV